MDLKANATLTHIELASQIFSVNVEYFVPFTPSAVGKPQIHL